MLAHLTIQIAIFSFATQEKIRAEVVLGGKQKSLLYCFKPCSSFREPGSGFREPGLGFREPGLGFREPGSGFREPGSGFRNPSSPQAVYTILILNN